jgi:hypothetical protein
LLTGILNLIHWPLGDCLAEKKKLGCLGTGVVVIFALAILGTLVGGPDDESNQVVEPTASQTTEPKAEPPTSEQPSEELTEAETQIFRVCRISQSSDAMTRRVIRDVGSGDASYNDKDYLETAIKNLSTAIEENDLIDSNLIADVRTQIELIDDIVYHFYAIEIYDDVNQYLADFVPINQAYLRFDSISERCGY